MTTRLGLFNGNFLGADSFNVRTLFSFLLAVAINVAVASAAVPVTVVPVTARHGMVVSAHPQATDAGLAVLKSGGNAIDAAIATSLAVGVAEPYGSGLGGKLMLLYFEARRKDSFGLALLSSLSIGAAINFHPIGGDRRRWRVNAEGHVRDVVGRQHLVVIQRHRGWV